MPNRTKDSLQCESFVGFNKRFTIAKSDLIAIASIYARIAVSLCTQITASEPSPTAKPTRLVEPARISPAARASQLRL
jgi:hypothetical protein